MRYLALIGDIVGSKELPQRDRFQTSLAAELKRLSTRHPGLVSPYTLTLGDEFQAIYKNADRLFLDIVSILTVVSPARARFAIGVGELSTKINPKQAIGMDGPAFHRAREVMTELKKNSKLLRFRGGPPASSASASAFDAWKLLNHAFDLASHGLVTWEANRLQIFRGLIAGQDVAALEKELGISKVAVYKNINAGALDDLLGLCAEATLFLNRELKHP